MTGYPEQIQLLIQALSRLPGIGKRSAERIVHYLLKARPDEVFELAERISQAKRLVRFCGLCGNFSADSECSVCQNAGRDHATICVVQEPRDISRIEQSGRYRGVYHVLFGAISPLEGVGPNDLRIAELERRIRQSAVQEAIIATATNSDGEATAIYLIDRLKALGIKVSRLARGLPFGSSLEFADEETLGNALEFRQPA